MPKATRHAGCRRCLTLHVARRKRRPMFFLYFVFCVLLLSACLIWYRSLSREFAREDILVLFARLKFFGAPISKATHADWLTCLYIVCANTYLSPLSCICPDADDV